METMTNEKIRVAETAIREQENKDKYGIETTKNQMLTKQTQRDSIRNITTWRNDLAHGKYSFASFGRDKLRYKTTGNRDKENDIYFLKES